MAARAPHLRSSGLDSRYGAGAPYSELMGPNTFLSLGCMEGLYDTIVSSSVGPSQVTVVRPAHWPGYVLAGVVALLAYIIHYLPFPPFQYVAGASGKVRYPVSAAIIAILLGLVLRNTLQLPATIKVGCKRLIKKGIPIAIVLTGAGLNLIEIKSVGVAALLITTICIIVAVAAGYYLGRLFGLESKTALLLGVGTGICGNSAIVAVAPLIDAGDEDLVLSIGTVNLYGLLAMLALPLIGGWLVLGDQRFGVWSGASIHAVPQVVAAGFAYSAEAGTIATGIKLVRVALLAPLVCVLALLHARHHVGDAVGGRLTVRYARLVPWFVWGFVAMSLLNTAGLIPVLRFEPAGFLGLGDGVVSVAVGERLTQAGKVLLTFAMAAIGLEVHIRQLAAVGGRALAAGLAASVVLAAVSLLLIYMFL